MEKAESVKKEGLSADPSCQRWTYQVSQVSKSEIHYETGPFKVLKMNSTIFQINFSLFSNSVVELCFLCSGSPYSFVVGQLCHKYRL